MPIFIGAALSRFYFIVSDTFLRMSEYVGTRMQRFSQMQQTGEKAHASASGAINIL
jgi:hypothetical protein